MKVLELKITDIGGIKNLSLNNLDPKMNIICGPNGIGKTTIIDCIGHIFGHGNTSTLKRNVNSKIGIVSYDIELFENERAVNSVYIESYKPLEVSRFQSLASYSIKLIHLKTNRSFDYENLTSINKDEHVNEFKIADLSMSGIYHTSSKSWFIHKFVFSSIENALEPEQLHNFELAKKCFSYLNKSYEFHGVDANNLDILINTPSGIIVYEYLSSGFKSIISIIFGIIREIELRFLYKRIIAEEFDGIILIDEIELHLHPEWQEQVSGILKKIFPNAQFFLTTHSPHVIQTALQGEVIALERDGNEVKQRDLADQEYGYLGWTIEEVLKHVMGMGSLKTPEYNKTRESFIQAFRKQDYPAAKSAFSKLEKMLHPESELIEIYKMQLLSLGD